MDNINPHPWSSFERRFSLGLPSTLDEDGVEAVKFIAESFHGLELPEPILRALETSDFISELTIVNITDPVSPSVSQSMAFQSANIKEDFVEHLLGLFQRMKALSIDSLSVDFGMEEASRDDSKREALVKLLKTLAPHFHRNRMKLLIPARIPSATDIPTSAISSIMRDTMCGLFRVVANVHPHELIHSEPMEHLRDFRFLMDAVSFVYEPEAGNFLVDKLLTPWFETLSEIHFEGDVIFKPAVSSWESLDDVVDDLHSLLFFHS